MSEHEPSDYEATINLTYQKMWELQKAVAARAAELIKRGEMHSEAMQQLVQISNVIEEHLTQAVEMWEAKVARVEAMKLDNEEERRKFFEN